MNKSSRTEIWVLIGVASVLFLIIAFSPRPWKRAKTNSRPAETSAVKTPNQDEQRGQGNEGPLRFRPDIAAAKTTGVGRSPYSAGLGSSTRPARTAATAPATDKAFHGAVTSAALDFQPAVIKRPEFSTQVTVPAITASEKNRRMDKAASSAILDVSAVPLTQQEPPASGVLASETEPSAVAKRFPDRSLRLARNFDLPIREDRRPARLPETSVHRWPTVDQQMKRLPGIVSVPVAAADYRRLGRHLDTPVLDGFAKWPVPTELIGQLEHFSNKSEIASWCEAVHGALGRLRNIQSLNSAELGDVFGELRRLEAGAHTLSVQTSDVETQRQLLHAAYALGRRLAVWEQIHNIAAEPFRTASVSAHGSGRMEQLLPEIEKHLLAAKHGRMWRDYLLIDELQDAVGENDRFDSAAARTAARRVLLRLQFANQDASQRAFCRHPLFVQLATELKIWAAEPINYPQLMTELEAFERTSSPVHAQNVAVARQTMLWSSSAPVNELGDALEMQYRNANIRLSVSDGLLNRMLPKPSPLREAVNEYIAGAFTQGTSETVTRLRVRLLPIEHQWRFGLVARGDVSSSTYSSRGPARFYNEGASEFVAEKMLVVDQDGIQLRPTSASASTSTDLTGVETDFDPVPLLGDLIQAIVCHLYARQAPEAQWEVEHRVATRAGRQLDAEVKSQIERAEKRFDEDVATPLRNLALNPKIVDLSTNNERLIGRFRLASYHQLAAHTPRPVAPSGNLLSFQLHQSALNNIIEQLNLDGREADLGDLFREIAATFNRADTALPEDFPDNVRVHFAEEQPVRVDLKDGRLSLTLRLAELTQGRNSWEDIEVFVHYQPALDQPGVDLVRDQYIELKGARRFRDQIALRAIFSRVFAKNQPITFVSDRLARSPRLRDLQYSQFVIEDGWLAFALDEPRR